MHGRNSLAPYSALSRTRPLIAQSLASLDKIYGPEGRESLENGAGLKLYITPRDERTVKEVSASVGKTTREAVTRSYGRSKGLMGAQSTTSRLEERPLLSETEARFMDPDDVIILAPPQHPIKARRIKYFEDPVFTKMMDMQDGKPLPYPPVRMVHAAEKSGEDRSKIEVSAEDVAAKPAAPDARYDLTKLKVASGSSEADTIDPGLMNPKAALPEDWKQNIAEVRDVDLGLD